MVEEVLSQKCHYHPHRPATTYCDRCRRPLCFDDNRLYRKQESTMVVDNSISGIGESTFGIIQTLNYCILCNANALRNDTNPIKVLIYLLPFIVFSIVISYVFPLALVIFIPFIVVFIIVYILQIKKSRQAEDEAILFKKSLRESPDASTYGFLTSRRGITTIDNSAHIDIYSQRGSKGSKGSKGSRSNRGILNSRPTKESIFHIVCFECGRGLELTAKFCPYCGDSTVDELKKFKKENKPKI
jgi:hypothetical protein